MYELLKQEIRNRGVTFKFVSKKTGINYCSLKSYLCGARPIPEAKLRLICMVFAIPLKIFGLDDTYLHHVVDTDSPAESA